MNEQSGAMVGRDGTADRPRTTSPGRSRVVSPLSEPLAPLAPFVEAGVFDDTEIQLVGAVERLARSARSDAPPLALLAVAVASRGFRAGHVCVDLTDVDGLIGDESRPDLPWPDPGLWSAALRSVPELVTVIDGGSRAPTGTDTTETTDTTTSDRTSDAHVAPLVLDGTLLYLQRHWIEETLVAGELLGRVRLTSPLALPSEAVDDSLDRFFGPSVTRDGFDWQRQGAKVALTSPISILVGGPGTGKTRTIARMLACLHTVAHENGGRVTVAAAAPSGKAAARMGEAIEQAVHQLHEDGLIDEHLAEQLRATPTMTIHRLLGANPRRGFRHHADDPLTYDMVIVDESSMIDLPLMSALFEALPRTCHLVVVGDPDQLASVGAGTVLGDIVHPVTQRLDADPRDDPTTEPSDGPTSSGEISGTDIDPSPGRITILRRAHRFGADSSIAALADAIRAGDATRTIEVLGRDRPDVDWIGPTDTSRLNQILDAAAAAAVESVAAARRGDVDSALAHMTSIKVLAALHEHRLGQEHWTERIEDRLFSSIDPDTVRIPWSQWYIGRPVMVTHNDPLLRISNGDTGTTVTRDGITTVVFDGRTEDRHEVQSARLDEVTTWWAMTIHKSQGSEFHHAIVSLPMVPTRILTRELLYTGITRARSKVTVIGSEEIIRAAVERPISRASGLQDRLWPALGATDPWTST